MKLLQRRPKRSVTLPQSNVLSLKMTAYQNLLSARWQVLSPRDQWALMLLTVFLLLFIGGYGGYSIHQAANKSKSDYQEQVADYFWLRAQSSNIDSNALAAANTSEGASEMSAAGRLNALLNSSGVMDAQVIGAGEAVQLSFSHASQAVVSSVLGNLEQQGWQFTQLSMQQDLVTKMIQVQATVTTL